MQAISAIDYVNRAVSTDEGRLNMQAAYREKDLLVATDGHRLHMVSGLVVQPTGGYVDGRDCQFPNYEMVLPKQPYQIATLKLFKKQIQYLNKVLKVLRDTCCGCKFTFDPKTGLTITGSSRGEFDTLTFTHNLPTVYVDREFEVGLNLRYFVDALIADVDMVFNATTEGGPTTLEADLHGSKYTAIIMPLKKDSY